MLAFANCGRAVAHVRAAMCHNQLGADAKVAPLFEDFVGSREQCSRHFEAERFGGLDVEHGFVFRRSLHREVGWFLAFQDAVDVGGDKPIQGGLINPEGDQSAFGEETAEIWDRMEP